MFTFPKSVSNGFIAPVIRRRVGSAAIATSLLTAVVVPIATSAILLSTSASASADENKGVQEIAKRLNKKPTYVLGNVKVYGRLKSLLTEMKLKDGYTEIDFDSPIDSTTLEKASVLILVDRESGDIPANLEYLKPSSLRGNQQRPDREDYAVLGIEERKGGYKTVYISAANRDALVSFIDDNVRKTKLNYDDFPKKGMYQFARKERRPTAPELLYPVGKVNSTRPPIFFLASRSDERVAFDIQVTPAGGSVRQRPREEFGNDGDTFQTDDGGWAAFDQTVRPADKYEMSLWGVKPPKGIEKQNKVIYIYQPEFDVRAGRNYTVSVRGTYSELQNAKPGVWSSDELDTALIVPPQPENLGASEALTRNDERSQFWEPVFSADGKQMVYSTDRASKLGSIIWELFADDPNAPGTGSSRLTSSNRGSRDSRPSWGPVMSDGIGYVTFARSERTSSNGPGAQNLWYVAVPTPEKPDVPIGYTQLTNFTERCSDPSWSMDGKKCAFVKDNGRGETEIWIVEPGKNPRVLTTGITPSWAPDNRTLYYSSNANGSYDIWSLDTLSGATKAITSDPGDEFSPAINPKGNGDLAYVSSASGNWDIWVLRGRNAVQLTQWLGNDMDPTWTPDGKKIVFATTRFSQRQRYGLASIDPYGTGTGQ